MNSQDGIVSLGMGKSKWKDMDSENDYQSGKEIWIY